MVLIVDDEEMVRRITRTILSRAGFQVIEAGNGSEALTVLESRSDIAILLTDCDMPVMNGLELAHIVGERWPDIRVLCTSGKPCRDAVPPGVDFIPKPYSASTLIPRIMSTHTEGLDLAPGCAARQRG
jgi:CheY-like chemotaxis protein